MLLIVEYMLEQVGQVADLRVHDDRIVVDV